MNDRRDMRGSLALALAFAVLPLAGTAMAGEGRTPGEKWIEAHRSPHQKQYYGEPINLSLKDADLVEVLRSFAEIGGFNLIIQPGIQGKVTVELKGVPWDQALEAILKINGLGMEITGGKVNVGASSATSVRSLAGDMVTVRLEPRYADAAVVAKALYHPAAGVPSPGGTIHAEAGKLTIRDTRPMLLYFSRVLTEIDVPEAASEDPRALAWRCVELWNRLVPGQPIG
ncbi:MAG: hypothetical protein GY719_11405 [bacterium]|nr:hypothetical protein [bacterium]